MAEAPAFQPFEVEQYLSRHEQSAAYNFSESGVRPMTLGELVAEPELREALFETSLNYPMVNGSPELRARIAARYPGARPENVLVTVGAAEANYDLLHALLSPGEAIAVMRPNYPQIAGVARNMGVTVRPLDLDEARGWAIDQASLAAAVTADTRLVAVCNPNNPTGAILSAGEMEAIVAGCDRVGAWLLADEVYAGAERESESETPTFCGRYDKVLAVGSMSKAYGLPGLRTGWVVAPEATIEAVWRRHEYTTISGTALGHHLAVLALSDEVRPRLLARTRAMVRRGYEVVEEFLAGHPELVQVVPPKAAGMAFLRYRAEIDSLALAERLRTEQGVLVLPGDFFECPRHLRCSFALEPDYVREGLRRLGAVLASLKE